MLNLTTDANIGCLQLNQQRWEDKWMSIWLRVGLSHPVAHGVLLSSSLGRRLESWEWLSIIVHWIGRPKKDVYPLPRIDDFLDKLVHARFLSAIDLASGYHQVGLAKDA